MRAPSTLRRGAARGESRKAAPGPGGLLGCFTSGHGVLWLRRGVAEHGTGLRLDVCSESSSFPKGNGEQRRSAAHTSAASPLRGARRASRAGRAVPQAGRAQASGALRGAGGGGGAGWGTGRPGEAGRGVTGTGEEEQAGIGAADPGPGEP
ncbi:alanine and glycine-rich protein-like [Prinia subflava]|uniref:alanine and glycine-rich protein-like n=1 Tax=Prinia subflava TaxID=208062 RepID=UPI002FDFB8F5